MNTRKVDKKLKLKLKLSYGSSMIRSKQLSTDLHKWKFSSVPELKLCVMLLDNIELYKYSDVPIGMPASKTSFVVRNCVN